MGLWTVSCSPFPVVSQLETYLLFSVEFNGILDDNRGHFYTVAYEAA